MKPTVEICANCELPVQSFEKGEVILEQGVVTGALFVLKEGKVEVTKEEVELTRTSKPGSVFGEVSLLLQTPHTATVRALENSTFFVIEDSEEFLKEHPDFHFHMSKLLANRLASLSNYLVDLKKQFESHADHLGMVDEVLESLVHHQPRK